MDSQLDKPTAQEVSGQSLLLWSIVILASFGWIFLDFLHRQFRFAIEKQADWGHTLVIPLIAGYFVWMCRGKLLAKPFKRAWSGLVFMLIGLCVYMVCTLGPSAWHHHNLMGMGVAMTFTGVVLFIFGWQAMRYLIFPLIFLFAFGQTISDRLMEVVTFKLQDIASIGSYYGLSFMGFDVTRAGNTLEIFYNNVSHPLNIAEACSGMRMLMAFLALGVAMAYTSLPYIWQRTCLVLCAVPTAVFVNILRVMTLGLLGLADSGFAAGNFHTFVGTLWLIPAFFIYLGIVWILKNIIIEDDMEDEEPEVNVITYKGSMRSGFVIAVTILVLSAVSLEVAVGQLNVYLHKAAVLPRKDFSVIPTRIGDWQMIGEDVRFDAAGVEALGTDLYLSRTYRNRDSELPHVQLHLAYYTGQVDAIPHVPDRCMVAGGYIPLTPEPLTLDLEVNQSNWKLDTVNELDGSPYPFVWGRNTVTQDDERIRMPIGNFQLRTTQFSHPKLQNKQIYAGYFFVANGKTTAYPERIRLIAFDPSEKHAFYCKIQFTTVASRSFEAENFREVVSVFTSEALPEIMKCLPDWVEVTNGSIKALSEEQE